MIQPAGNQLQYAYDENGNLTGVILEDGVSSVGLSYDLDSNLKSIRDPGGATTDYHYDSFGRLIGVVDAEGNSQVVLWDPDGNLVESLLFDGQEGRNPNRLLAPSTSTLLRSTRFLYDELSQMHATEDARIPSGAVAARTSWVHDAAGRIRSVTNANAHTVLYDYDALNRLTSIRHQSSSAGGQSSRQYAYDANSNLVRWTEVMASSLDPGSSRTVIHDYEYDALNRLKREVTRSQSPGSQLERRFNYDSRNNMVLSRSMAGYVVTRSFDGLSRLTATSHVRPSTGGGAATMLAALRTEWDENSRPVRRIDPNGNVTTFRYDVRGRPIRTIFADGTQVTRVYSPANELLLVTDQNFTTVRSSYDRLGRLTGRRILPGPSVTGTTSESYQYDGLSRLTLAQNDVSTVRFSWDSLSNLTSESVDGVTVTSEYDAAGNRTLLRYPSGATLSYQYDDLDRPIRVRDSSSGYSLDLAYLGMHDDIERIVTGSGVTATGQYDALGRIQRLDHRGPSGAPILDFSYEYANSYRRSAEIRNYGPWGSARDEFRFDGMGRLVGASTQEFAAAGGTQNALIQLDLDAAANRRSFSRNGLPETYSMTASDRSGNRYSARGSATFAYDSAGNMISDSGRRLRYGYDFRNQVTEVRDEAARLLSTYAYDALGRRIRGGPPEAQTAVVLDGLHEIEERQGGQVIKVLFHGDTLDEIYGMLQGPNLSYFHQDARKSVRAVTASDASTAERYEYSPFGDTIVFSPGWTPLAVSGIGNDIQFAGGKHDRDTRLYSFRARQYDSSLGRFLSREPLGMWSSLESLGNGYTYALSDPVNLTDQLGLAPQVPAQTDTFDKIRDLLKQGKPGEQQFGRLLADAWANMTKAARGTIVAKGRASGIFEIGNLRVSVNKALPGLGRRRPDIVIDMLGDIVKIVDPVDSRTNRVVSHLRKTARYCADLAKRTGRFVAGVDYNLALKRFSRPVFSGVAAGGRIAGRIGRRAIPVVGPLVALLAGAGTAYAAETPLERADAVVSNVPSVIPVVGNAWGVGTEIGMVIRGLEVEVGKGNRVTVEKLSEGAGEAAFDIAQENGGGVTGYLKGVVKFYFGK
jgi:RHS repeat-associated protein